MQYIKELRGGYVAWANTLLRHTFVPLMWQQQRFQLEFASVLEDALRHKAPTKSRLIGPLLHNMADCVRRNSKHLPIVISDFLLLWHYHNLSIDEALAELKSSDFGPLAANSGAKRFIDCFCDVVVAVAYADTSPNGETKRQALWKHIDDNIRLDNVADLPPRDQTSPSTTCDWLVATLT